MSDDFERDEDDYFEPVQPEDDEAERNVNPLVEYIVKVIRDAENLPDDHIWLNTVLRDKIQEYAPQAWELMERYSMNRLMSPEEVHAAVFSTYAIEAAMIKKVIANGEAYYTIPPDGSPHLTLTGEGWRQVSKSIAAVVIAVMRMLRQDEYLDRPDGGFPDDGINLEDF